MFKISDKWHTYIGFIFCKAKTFVRTKWIELQKVKTTKKITCKYLDIASRTAAARVISLEIMMSFSIDISMSVSNISMDILTGSPVGSTSLASWFSMYTGCWHGWVRNLNTASMSTNDFQKQWFSILTNSDTHKTDFKYQKFT